MTAFTLIMSPIPSEETLSDYAESLGGADAVISSMEHFAKVPAWFDDFEVRTENPVVVQPGTLSDPEDDEEEEKMRNTDTERLANVKRMLFKINQTNTKVLKVGAFIENLKELI